MMPAASDFLKTTNDCEYVFNDRNQLYPELPPDVHKDFRFHGFVILRQLFTSSEIDKVLKCIHESAEFAEAKFQVRDTSDSKRQYLQSQWMEPGEDMLGRLAGNAKVNGIAKQLINAGDLYMTNGKLLEKEPEIGGELNWHQDLGEWYINFNFCTVGIATTRSDVSNGGVELIDQGHKYGRWEHIDYKGQPTSDPIAIETLRKEHTVVPVNLSKGDAVFFHGNMPHRSLPNHSKEHRANFVFNFNAKSNVMDRTVAPVDQIVGEYPYFNAQLGDHELKMFHANIIKDSTDYQMQKRRFLRLN